MTVSLDGDGEEDKKPESKAEPTRILLSEQGEKALDRIRRQCGDSVADAIDNGTIKISENHLIRWAEEDNESVRSLAYYVIDMRWNFPRALAFDKQEVNNRTTVEELSLFAAARGGKTWTHYNNFKITIELQGQAAA